MLHFARALCMASSKQPKCQLSHCELCAGVRVGDVDASEIGGGSGLSEDTRITRRMTFSALHHTQKRFAAVWLMGEAIFQLCNLTGYDEMATWPMDTQ